MDRKSFSIMVVVALSLTSGCDRQDSTSSPAPAPTPSGTSTVASQPSASDLQVPTTMQGAGADVRAAGERAAAEARGAVDSTRDAARQATTQAQTQAAGAVQMTSDEAKKLLDQAVVYVKENKYDLAEKALAQVEAQKASLPKSIQDRLAGARTALNAAKAGGGIKIPGLGGGDVNK